MSNLNWSREFSTAGCRCRHYYATQNAVTEIVSIASQRVLSQSRDSRRFLSNQLRAIIQLFMYFKPMQ